MKNLSTEDANQILAAVGMAIGNWNEIVDSKIPTSEMKWTNYQAPSVSRELFCFSRHVAGWLPNGDWKLLQLDNSNDLDANKESLLTQLLFGANSLPSHTQSRSFLFHRSSRDAPDINDLIVANLIHALLLIEGFGYFVSSGSNQGQRLGIQDGVIYFVARDEKSIEDAKALLEGFESDPNALPPWVTDLIAAGQEGIAGRP